MAAALKIIAGVFSEYSAGWLRDYFGANDGFLSNDLPFTPIALTRLEWCEPTVSDQGLGDLDCVLSVEADGTGSELGNLS